MNRMTTNNPVRRRLFPVENLDDQAKSDNCTNRFKEELARETREKSKKWNFDFAKELALEGPYEWYEKDGDKFVHMLPVGENVDPSEKCSPMQYENENTPRSLKEESNMVVRKRKWDKGSKACSEAVKRKISFD